MSDHLESLFQLLQKQDGTLPPVRQWNPTDEKDIGMRITANGAWLYQGTPIRRKRMVRLFSTVLRRDGDQHFLVTPVEKVKIDVEVCAFLAIRMEIRCLGEQEIAFETNVGDIVVVDHDHPIRVQGSQDKPLPVVMVRDGLEALIVRSVFYELVENGQVTKKDHKEILRVASCGQWFELGAVA